METSELSKEQIKKIKSLRKKSGRDEYGLFIAEGYKICREVLNSFYTPKYIVLPGNANSESISLAVEISKKFKVKIQKVQRKIFDTLCDTDTPQDILVCLKIQENEPIKEKSFIALDKVSDPGNVGTIIRTAEWFGYEQVILNEGCSDIYNPKTVRASMGAVLRVPCIQIGNMKEYLRKTFPNHHILGTFLNGDKFLSEVTNREKIGIVFGNESTGISDELSTVIDEKIKIRGSGKFDSLNVSVAAGIVMHELSTKK